MKTKITYIGTGILEICKNARISRRQLRKVKFGSSNAKKKTL